MSHSPESVSQITAIEDARKLATELGVKFSGNTGLETLKTKMIEVLNVMEVTPTTIDFGGG